MSEEYENDIKHDAYFLISLFEKEEKSVTNLQVQKLMYFFEAYYMATHDNIQELYDCPFKAWAYGPVAIPLYKEFRKFGNQNIILTDEQRNLGMAINIEKKKYIKEIYDIFGGLSAVKLVELTHLENSPWYETWKTNNESVSPGNESNISKQKTKEWFKEKFIVDG